MSTAALIEEEPVFVHLEGAICIDNEVVLVQSESVAKGNCEEGNNEQHTHCGPYFIFHVTGDILTAYIWTHIHTHICIYVGWFLVFVSEKEGRSDHMA